MSFGGFGGKAAVKLLFLDTAVAAVGIRFLSNSELRNITTMAVVDQTPCRGLAGGPEGTQAAGQSCGHEILPLQGHQEQHVQEEVGDAPHAQSEGFPYLWTHPNLDLQAKAFTNYLSSRNCIQLRDIASKLAASRLTSCCDTFIKANLSRMLNEKELISLPRVQVNVDVSQHLEEGGARSLDVEGIVPSIVRELSRAQHSSAFACRHFYLEKLVVMELLSDLSVQVMNSLKKKSHLSVSSGLHKPSSQGGKQGFNGPSVAASEWGILASHTVGNGAMAVVRQDTNDLLVLNIQMVTKDSSPNVFCPISPTTGIPLAANDSLMAQMLWSRSGFGVVSLGNALMSVGGFDRSSVMGCSELYSPRSNAWTLGGTLTTPRARLAVVQHNEVTYALGGSDGNSELRSVEVCSNRDNRWKLLPCKMCTTRSDFDAAVLDGRIYAVGGESFSRLLRSAEVFDPVKSQWKHIPSMSVPRRGVAVVSCNSRIYAIGGQAASWGCHSSVECYDPATNEWNGVASMTMPRRNASAVAVEDRIYVIGGYNGSSAVNVVEVYDPASNTWSNVDPMVLKRSGAAAVLHEGAIYVVGGYSGSIFLNSVERYDLESGHWTSYFHTNACI